MVEIKSIDGVYKAVINEHGAELWSFTENEREALWYGDNRYWKERAPILFPIVGGLRDKKALIRGREYSMGRHGFARHMEFTLSSSCETEASFKLESGDETRAQYPFDFELTVTYRFDGSKLITAFTVKNTSVEPMPYCIGGHPGFLTKGGLENWEISFERPETAGSLLVTPEGLIDAGQVSPVLNGDRSIKLNHNLFYNDALVFDSLVSRSVTLINSMTRHGVRMDFSGFDYFGIWQAKDAPYICLEPWTGHATLTTESDELEKKRGMTFLSPGSENTHSFSIELM